MQFHLSLCSVADLFRVPRVLGAWLLAVLIVIPSLGHVSPAVAQGAEAAVPEGAAAAVDAGTSTELVSQPLQPAEPAAAEAPVTTAAPAAPQQALPHDLSAWGMFKSADVVVKAVMIGLLLASVLTWTIFLAKTLELRAARRQLRGPLAVLESLPSLADAARHADMQSPQLRCLIEAALAEMAQSARLPAAGIKERVASRLERLEAAAGRSMRRGVSILASIGSTGPFIGLFGTVWGIMNSFIGISKSQTTNLAVVAPGIAEALLATAMGLVAAIPAVLIYNHFTKVIGEYRAQLGDFSAAVQRHVSRDLDREAVGERPQRLKAVE